MGFDDVTAKSTTDWGLYNRIYCLTVLEARSPTSRYWKVLSILRAVRGNLFHAFHVANGNFLAIFAVLGIQKHHLHHCLVILD